MEKLELKIYSDLIGKEFKFMGRGPEYYDCLGLCYEIYKRLGIIMEDHISVIDRKLRKEALEEGKKLFEKIDKPFPGCFVGFRIAGLTNHVAIMLDDDRFIHIQRKKTVCIERINTLMWEKRVDGFYRLKEKNINE